MPEYNRVVLSGTMGSGGEIWSVGVNYSPVTGTAISDPADLNLWAAAIVAGPIFNLPSTLNNSMGTGTLITRVACYYYPNTGPVPALAVGESAASRQGGGSGSPLSTCIVTTLRTNFSGRRYRGRIYWPAVGFEVEINGLFDNTDEDGFVLDMAEFLEGIGAAASAGGGDLQLVVVSHAGGLVTPVTSLAVDNAPDTQRRRDENLVPSVETTGYPAP